ncbi:MAG TPA: hypothetical protein PK760_07750 [Flavobacteriales bacterium]|nr:hypothetical protein [Flavobacteriales bacterium]
MRTFVLTFLILCGLPAAAQRPLPMEPLRTDTIPKVHLDRTSLPSFYDYQKLGVFCKLDVQLEKHLPLPVRFRLCDPMLVDAWEGKGPLLLPVTIR